MLSVSSLETAGFDVAFDLEAYEPVGCSRCGSTGYKGRVGLYEVMTITDEIRDLTIERASCRRDPQGRGRAGHAPAARGRLREGQARHHVHRRGCKGHVNAALQPIRRT